MGLYIGVQKDLMGEAHGLHYLLSGHWEFSRLGGGGGGIRGSSMLSMG